MACPMIDSFTYVDLYELNAARSTDDAGVHTYIRGGECDRPFNQRLARLTSTTVAAIAAACANEVAHSCEGLLLCANRRQHDLFAQSEKPLVRGSSNTSKLERCLENARVEGDSN